MNISAITSTDQPALSLKVGVAVTKMAMNSEALKSQSLVSIMEQSVNPNLGKNIDVRV